jgi:hypothetical protein
MFIFRSIKTMGNSKNKKCKPGSQPYIPGLHVEDNTTKTNTNKTKSDPPKTAQNDVQSKPKEPIKTESHQKETTETQAKYTERSSDGLKPQKTSGENGSSAIPVEQREPVETKRPKMEDQPTSVETRQDIDRSFSNRETQISGGKNGSKDTKRDGSISGDTLHRPSQLSSGKLQSEMDRKKAHMINYIEAYVNKLQHDRQKSDARFIEGKFDEKLLESCCKAILGNLSER